MPRTDLITIPRQTAVASVGPLRSALIRVLDGLRSYTLGPLTLKDPELARQLNLYNGGPTASGVPVNEFSALNYAAVWSAVSLISSQAASLPLILYKRLPNGGKSRLTTHQTYRLLHDEPNPEMSSMVMRETLMAHCLTWGNGYAEIERDQLGRPLNLWPLLPNQVEPYRDQARRLRYLVRTPGVPDVEIPAADMLHVPGLGFDGLKGYPVIQMARESLGLGLAAQKFGATFFGNGSTFGGVLQHPKTLGEPALNNLKASIEARHTGVERAHRFLILEEGMTYEKLGIAPNDAQFLETRQFEISEVARWFNVPPHKLKDLMRATFSNIEQQAIEFVVDCLQPWLVRWEQELNRKLIARSERNIQFVEHLVEGLLRGDSAARAAFYREMFNVGALSIDEMRERENLNPIGKERGGDVHWVPLNMAPADLAMQPKPEPAAPAPADPQAGANQRVDELIIEMRETRTGWERISQAVIAQDQQLALVASQMSEEQTARASIVAQLEVAQGATKQALEAELATRDQAARELAETQRQMQESRDRWATDRADLEQSLTAKQAELVTLSALVTAQQAELERSTVTVAELEATRAAQVQRADEAEAAYRRIEAEAAGREGTLRAESDARLTAVTRELETARQEQLAAEQARVALEASLTEQRTMTTAHIAAWAEERESAAARVAVAEAKVAEVLSAHEALASARDTAVAEAEARRLAAEAEYAAFREQAQIDLRETERRLQAEREHALALATADATAQLATARAESDAAHEAALVEVRTQAEAELAALRAALDAAQSEAAAHRAAADAEVERAARFEAAASGERQASVVSLAEAVRRAEEEAAARADAQAQAEASVTALQAELDRAQADVVAQRAASTAEAERAARMAAEAMAEREAAVVSLAAAARRAEEAAAAKAEAIAQAESLRQAEAGRFASVVSAHRSLVVDTMQRMIQYEADRVRRAQATPEKLRTWMESFYDGHEDLCLNALLPVIRVHLAWLGSGDDPIAVTRDLARRHVEQSRARLRAVISEDPDEFSPALHRVLHHWEQQRAQEIADQLLQKELDHARRTA